MPRSSSLHNASKKTFKSYIDLEVPNISEEPNNEDLWPSLDDSVETVIDDANRYEANHKNMNRSTASIVSLNSFNDSIDGVNYFYSHTNRSTGICGQLNLDSAKLTFSNYNVFNDHSSDNSNHLYSFAPFLGNDSYPPPYVDIYILNIGDIREVPSLDGNFIKLSIYCADFRRVEFQMKNCNQSKRLIEKLRLLTEDGIVNGKYSKLTKCLIDNYSYAYKADWKSYEGQWCNCYKLRLTQCNENFQISDTLPQAFIVPKTLSDSFLINSIATKTRGQRVPIVTYLYLKNGNLLIRSPAFEFYDDLNAMLKQTVNPLRQIDIDTLVVPLIVVQQSYEKLREACYLYRDSNGFLTKIGKWMSCINSSLKVVSYVTEILTKEASVGLVEDVDKHWNCVISSLVQLVIDPNRRTIRGFESLISKDWLYLCGHAFRTHAPNNPNHILFTLFLDCVWQLIHLNPNAFEFTSFYLIWLFDCQYMQLPLPTRKSSASFESTQSTAPPITSGLSVKHLMIIHNPFFKPTDNMLKLYHHISQLKFWSSLYLRWHTNSNYDLLTHELLYINELKSFKRLWDFDKKGFQ